MNMQEAIDDLVQNGIDDWVDNVAVAWVAKSIGGAKSPDEIRIVALQVVAEPLRGGYMNIGELNGPGDTFQKWDMTIAEALAHADLEWRSLGRRPLTGEVFWLCNTPKGDQRASLPDGLR